MASSSSASASTAPESVNSTPDKQTPRIYPSGFRFSSAGRTKHTAHEETNGKTGKLQSSAASTPGLGYYGNSAKQGVANQPGSAIVASQMFKTKLCIDNQTKGCSRGAECPYAHSVDEMRSLPDLRKTKMCSLVLSGKGCKNKACKFAHSEDELRYTCNFSEFKTRICRFAQEQGGRGCLYGVRCPYAHSPSELRHLESPTISPTEILVQERKTRVPFVSKSPHTKVVLSSSKPGSCPLKKKAEVAQESQKKTSASLEHQLQGRHGCRPSLNSEERRRDSAWEKTSGGESPYFPSVEKLNCTPQKATACRSSHESAGVHLLPSENRLQQCKQASYSQTGNDEELGSSSQENRDKETSLLPLGFEASNRMPRSLAKGHRAATENAGKFASTPVDSTEPRHENKSENQAFLLRDCASCDKPLTEGTAMPRTRKQETKSPLFQAQQPPSFLVSSSNAVVPPPSAQDRDSSSFTLIDNAALDAHTMARVLSAGGLRGAEANMPGTPPKQNYPCEKTRTLKTLSGGSNTPPATTTYRAQAHTLSALNTAFSTEEIFFPMAPRPKKMEEDVFNSVLPPSLPLVASSPFLDKRNATQSSSEATPLLPPPGFEHIRLEKKDASCGKKMPDFVENLREGPLTSSFSENTEVDQHEQLFLQLQRQLLLQCWGKVDDDALLLPRNLALAPTANPGGRAEQEHNTGTPVSSDLSNDIFHRPGHASRLPVDWVMWESELQGGNAQHTLGGFADQELCSSKFLTPRDDKFASSAANKQFLDVHSVPQPLFVGKFTPTGAKTSRNNGLGTLSVREKGDQKELSMLTGRKLKENQELGELLVAAESWQSAMVP
ncbi:putative zinc finger (CCCH type) protein [Neospora caninum Liverpool]|uniref:Putative zinc finger (CCCH type) protein n=1 Tax=Neospora caninum (strain Liverpool) TaxID=572307 RepID=F0VHK0_NEOCL|nr:putative zinc finger (CCCH type) protein [Neospora caninum Liverpool]CBZ53194.1 putative zinc finger (CCCH type) protein [Neospora caninum Liverpool]CEL67184.1 TPA: zinc finger (CCCH type) protein, putative [Neospora caninum Liverpool]|eukprot:XP_003883226.1 putative zinc finger (CCCH type) protein [Neospora caninum Liverpool]